MILPAEKIQNGPRPFQKGCETVFSFISILAGRSAMRTFYLELLKNFKFEVGHKNVSIYFSLDTPKWTQMTKKFKLQSAFNYFLKCVPFHIFIFWASCFTGKPLRITFHVNVGAKSLEK